MALNVKRKYISREWLFLWSFLIASGFLFPQIETLVMGLLCVRALKGARQTMEAAVITCFYILASPVFVEGATREFLRYLMLASGFVSLLVRSGKQNSHATTFLWWFVLFFTLSSFLTSKIPSISVLKIISFFLGSYIMVEGFQQVKHNSRYWFVVINTFFVSAVYGSLIFFFLGFGFEENGRGFQGIFSHPQNFGPVMGVVTAWFLGLILSKEGASKFIKLTGCISLVFVFMSLARTGLVAFVGGIGLAYLLGFRRKKNIDYASKGLRLIILAISILLAAGLTNPTFIQETIVSFVQKREGQNANTSLDELFNQSRGQLTVTSLENFSSHPLFGIGFGVPSNTEDLALIGNVKYFAGVPISASVEKGFLPTAILEEIGLIGAMATFVLITIIFSKVRRKFSLPMLWLLSAAILINVGEAIFFSVGGTGFFMWLIVGICYSFDFFRTEIGPKERIKFTDNKVKFIDA